MFSFFPQSKKLDKKISSFWRFDSEGASVTLVNSLGVIIFYHSVEHELFRYDERPIDIQLFDALQRTSRLLIDIVIKNGVLPENAKVIIGEPWSHSFSKRIVYKRKNSFTVTQNFIRDMLVKDSKASHLEQYGFNTQLHIPATSSEIIGVFLSGHPVIHWQGKKVKEIAVDSMVGFFDKNVVQYIGRMIHEYTRVKILNISYHTIQSVIGRYLATMIKSPSLVVYPSGLLTQLFWVDVYGVRSVGTFPIGLYQVENSIRKTMGISRNEIQSLLTLAEQKIIEDRIEKKIQKSFLETYQVWEDNLQRFCKQWVQEGLATEQVVWIGDNDRNLFLKMVYTLWQDKDSFSIVFGSPKVQFMHSEQLLMQEPIFDHYREMITDVDLMIIKKFQ